MATQKILRMPVKLDATGITGNNSNAILEINSTTQGLLPPRMTTTQRTAMSNVEGMLVYDTDLDTLYQNNGTVWSIVGSGADIAVESWTTDANYTTVNTTAKRLIILHSGSLSTSRSLILTSPSVSQEVVVVAGASVSATNKIVVVPAYKINGTSFNSIDVVLPYSQTWLTYVGNAAGGFPAGTWSTSQASPQFTETTTTLTASKYVGTLSGFNLPNNNSFTAPFPTGFVEGSMTYHRGTNALFVRNSVAQTAVFLPYILETGWKDYYVAGNVLKYWDATTNIASTLKPIEWGNNTVWNRQYILEHYPSDGTDAQPFRCIFQVNSTGVPSILQVLQSDGVNQYTISGGQLVLSGLRGYTTVKLRNHSLTNRLPELYEKYSADGQTTFLTGTGGLGVGHTSQNASAILHLDSTTKGFLPPRMTATQMTAIASPATGLIVYQTDGTAGLYQYNGTAWVGFASMSGLSTNYTPYWDGTKLVNSDLYRISGAGQTGGIGTRSARLFQAMNSEANGENALGVYKLINTNIYDAQEIGSNSRGLRIYANNAPAGSASLSYYALRVDNNTTNGSYIAWLQATDKTLAEAQLTAVNSGTIIIRRDGTISSATPPVNYNTGFYFEIRPSTDLTYNKYGNFYLALIDVANKKSGFQFIVNNNKRMTLHEDGGLLIGTGAVPNASAALDVDSTTKGFLPPRMTATQMTAIASPATGLIVYQTDGTAGLYQYNGTAWSTFGNLSGSGLVTNKLLTYNGTSVTSVSGMQISSTWGILLGYEGSVGSSGYYLSLLDTSGSVLLFGIHDTLGTVIRNRIQVGNLVGYGQLICDNNTATFMTIIAGYHSSANVIVKIKNNAQTVDGFTYTGALAALWKSSDNTASTILQKWSNSSDTQIGVLQNDGLYFGTGTKSASALSQLDSTTQGFLAPRMTAAQRVAIVSPVAGLLVYQTDVHAGFWYYDGTIWQDLSQPRVGTTASSATPTINTDVTDYYEITGQTVDITSFTTNLTGTPVRGQKLWIDITGTAARAITWGASFEASTIALPTTTVNTNKLSVGFIWNVATSKWRCIGTC